MALDDSVEELLQKVAREGQACPVFPLNSSITPSGAFCFIKDVVAAYTKYNQLNSLLSIEFKLTGRIEKMNLQELKTFGVNIFEFMAENKRVGAGFQIPLNLNTIILSANNNPVRFNLKPLPVKEGTRLGDNDSGRSPDMDDSCLVQGAVPKLF